MKASLKLETNKYQIFDMGYGVILLNRELINIDKTFGFNNVFMQGDDANNFLNELDGVIKNNIEEKFINSWLSAYDDVMEVITNNELEKIVVFSKK